MADNESSMTPVTPNSNVMWNWYFIKHFLGIGTPLILVLITVLWLLYRTQAAANLSIIQVKEQQAIQLASQAIDTTFLVLTGDALYLAEHSLLRQWLNTGDTAVRSRLVTDFLAFMRHRQLYDQISYLDEHGQEIVRINWNNGHPVVIPDEQLQNKFEHQYVKEALNLDRQVVYMSPFEINIEHNVIEQPIKPTIRLSSPAFDSKGQKRGIIVLSYRGQRLLNRLRGIDEQTYGNLWLLNAGGYWLLGSRPEMLGSRPEMEWGFMFPDRQRLRFDYEYGEDIWSHIQKEQNTQPDQWMLENGLFIFARITPAQLMHEKGLFTYSKIIPTKAQNNIGGESWFLVTHVPPPLIAKDTAEYTRTLNMVFWILAPLLTLLSGIIAYHAMRRREAEAESRASNARFRELFSLSPDAIIIVDKDGRINLTNTQAGKCFGYTDDELVGQLVEQLVPERFRSYHHINRQKYVNKPINRPMGEGLELYGRRKDGSEFPVEISLIPLKTDQGLIVITIIRDITMRKQAEQIWMRYQKLVNNLLVGVYRSVPQGKGRFLELNPAMVKIFEAESIEQLLNISFEELYCDPTERNALVDNVLCHGHVSGEEVRLKTLLGREFDAAITAVMKKDNTGEVYFDGILEDISIRKEGERKIQHLNSSLRTRSQELEVINRELEAFSYSVSHDLRAPLRAIDGFSQTLLTEYNDRLDDRGRDRLRRVRSAAQRMADLIDDLLKLSRVTRTEIKWEVVNLTKIANLVIEGLHQGEPNRIVKFSVKPGMVITGDARLLRIAMDNLLGNAWKFTSKHSGAMIEVGSILNGQESYFVRDNGAGFDMAYADKLFGAFQRLHGIDEFPGTGIGLATVQRIIHKHGGHIWAKSSINQGSTFYFTLNEKESDEL